MARRTVQPQDLLRLPLMDRRSHGRPGVPCMRGARHASPSGLEKGSRAERRAARQRGVRQLGTRDATAVRAGWSAGCGGPQRPAAPSRAQRPAARGRAQRERGRPSELRGRRGRRPRRHGPREPRRRAVGRPQGGARGGRHRPPCGGGHSRPRRRPLRGPDGAGFAVTRRQHGPHLVRQRQRVRQPGGCGHGRRQGGGSQLRRRPAARCGCGRGNEHRPRRDSSGGHRRLPRPKAPPRTSGKAGHQRAARTGRPERPLAPAAAAGRRRLRQRCK